MGHYWKECPNLPSLPTRENMVFSTWRFFVKKKDKIQVHLTEPMSERRKKTLMGLKKNIKIPKDVVDVMSQTKQSLEENTHLDINVKRFKEMARAPKEKKIDEMTSVTLEMVDKHIIRPKGIISNVAIIVMKVSTSEFPCGIRRKWGLPNTIR